MKKTFCTLGPEGTCHDNALRNLIEHNGIKDFEIRYMDDFIDAANLLKDGHVDYIIQNCAHPTVYELNERYRHQIFIISTFVFPTKKMGILKRLDAGEGRRLGLMPATKGYIDQGYWDELIFETANPVVGEKLAAGEYDYGVTFIEYADKYADTLEVFEDFGGEVDTAWIIYGRERAFEGKVIGGKL